MILAYFKAGEIQVPADRASPLGPLQPRPPTSPAMKLERRGFLEGSKRTFTYRTRYETIAVRIQRETPGIPIKGNYGLTRSDSWARNSKD